MHTLKVKKFSEDAVLPKKGRLGDAGFDISSVEDIIIPPNSWKLVNTGIGITVPIGTYGRLAPRSGVSTKGIMINAGVIDYNYTGIIKCLMMNLSPDKEYQVKKGDRICQLILEKIVNECNICEVDTLEETDRGANGFGSSGV